MRALLLTLVACGSDPAPVTPDAGLDPDAALSGNGTATSECWFWNGPTKCAPRCSNKTLLGRYVFGENNTCEYADGRMCETANMTGPADSGHAGCCVVVGAEVDFWPCQ